MLRSAANCHTCIDGRTRLQKTAPSPPPSSSCPRQLLLSTHSCNDQFDALTPASANQAMTAPTYLVLQHEGAVLVDACRDPVLQGGHVHALCIQHHLWLQGLQLLHTWHQGAGGSIGRTHQPCHQVLGRHKQHHLAVVAAAGVQREGHTRGVAQLRGAEAVVRNTGQHTVSTRGMLGVT